MGQLTLLFVNGVAVDKSQRSTEGRNTASCKVTLKLKANDVVTLRVARDAGDLPLPVERNLIIQAIRLGN